MGLNNLFNWKKKNDTVQSTNPTTTSPAISRSSSSVNSRIRIEEELEQVFKKFDVNGDGKISPSELEQVFKKFDVNGDGKISSSELGSIMRSLGHRPNDEELQNMITEVDSDGDGFIDLHEFIELNTKDINSDEVLENLKNAFSVFDIDKNGLISAEELHKVLRSLEEDCSIGECRKMIAGIDVNGDGMISFDEFRVMMMSGTRFDGIGIKKE